MTEMDKEKQKNIIQKLQKQLEAHWKNTEEERKRTHTGIMYERYINEKRNEDQINKF